MGLRDTLRASVKAAFRALGDLVTNVTFESVTVGAYDPTSDAHANTTVSYVIPEVVLVGLTEAESQWFPPDRVTQKMLIAAVDLPVVPKNDDHVLIDGTTWMIIRVKGVPGTSLWTVFLQVA
jgi:hypothetical protein